MMTEEVICENDQTRVYNVFAMLLCAEMILIYTYRLYDLK